MLSIRKVISAILALLLIIEPALLMGCSEDPSATPEGKLVNEGIETGENSGAVDKAEIVGDSLSVFSVWDETVNAVDQDGSFHTTASREGAQLLFLTDTAGDLKGLAFSVPNDTTDMPPKGGKGSAHEEDAIDEVNFMKERCHDVTITVKTHAVVLRDIRNIDRLS